AASYSQAGALIVFEPSANSEPRLFEEAIEAADIVKYSEQRLAAIPRMRSKKQRIEVQTLGAVGLRFRIGGSRGGGTWRRLPAIAAGSVVDTAGAGDWCTAGFLARLGLSTRGNLR